MEFPILQKLPSPHTAIRIVTAFLREPHPTAALIKALQFRHYSWGFSLSGDAIRYHRQNVYPPRFCQGKLTDVMKMFEFDEDTGELVIPYDDGLTIDDLRAFGFAEDTIAAMGFDVNANPRID